MHVLPVPLSLLTGISAFRISVPADLRPPQPRKDALDTVRVRTRPLPAPAVQTPSEKQAEADRACSLSLQAAGCLRQRQPAGATSFCRLPGWWLQLVLLHPCFLSLPSCAARADPP